MRIKHESVIKTEAQLNEDRAAAQKIKDERDKKARERKERMKALEIVAETKAKKTDSEVAELARNDAIRQLASEKIDNNRDVVKLLGSMSARAIAFTIRDKQLEEKKRAESREEEYNARMNIVMEVDRMKDIQRREEEEAFKRMKRVQDRKVISEQIESRRGMKVLAAEARENENAAMRAMMAKYSEEDARAAERRRAEIAASRADFMRAHEDSVFRREEVRAREARELGEILVYQTVKDAEAKAREDAERALERVKKVRLMEMLAAQERVQNNAGKLDEVRARRAGEERERRAREKEREEGMKKKAEVEELMAARAVQAGDKVRRGEAVRVQLQREYEGAVRHMQEMDVKEVKEGRVKQERAKEYRERLNGEIEDRRRVREGARGGTFDEGYRLRQEFVREEARVAVIRDKLVQDLEYKGVNPKYLTEMKNCDISKIINR